MPNPMPAYTAQFRQQMIDLVAIGRSPRELSRVFGCHETSILSWMRAAKARESTPAAADQNSAALRRTQCGVTHSAGAIMAGYVAQGGAWMDSAPWLLALPLGVSVLPSILLAGCPDRTADEAAAKRTLVVRLGKRGAVRPAMAKEDIWPR